MTSEAAMTDPRSTTTAPARAGASLFIARACALALAGLLGSLPMTTPAAAAPPEGVADVVRLKVHDESGLFAGAPTEPLFCASSAEAWNPGANRSVGTFAPEGGAPGGWIVEIPRAHAESPAFAFKFTRGDWGTVEVSEGGGDVANRTLPALDWGPGAGRAELSLAVAGFADQRGERWPELAPPGAPRASTVTGDLETFELRSAVLGNTRTIRVWTPPGYGASDRAYPVLYMNDGQNLFDAATSFAGVEWGADEAATALIEEGAIPALIIVGIDNAGADRAAEYNPPETTWQGRPNRADRYLAFVARELMPEIARRYRVLEGPAHTAFGGSSFGGNVTLYACMERPGLFGRAIVESPASWIGDGAIVRRMRTHKQWPDRIYLAMGDAETGDADDDASLVRLAREIETVLRGHGLGEDRLRFELGAGAAHHERAWADRLPGALRFLYSGAGTE